MAATSATRLCSPISRTRRHGHGLAARDLLAASDGLLAVDGQRRVMTILFCDVAGFTGASERMTPQGLVKILNSYFSTMSAPIRENDGIIDKYIGDAIMA